MSDIYIPIPPEGSPYWKDAVATAGDLPLLGNIPGEARVAIDSQVIYVWSGASWVAATGGGGGIVGSPDTFTYFNSGGLAATLPNWNVDTTQASNRYGVRYSASVDPALMGANYSLSNSFTTSFRPTADAPDDSEILLQVSAEFDPDNSGFGFGTSGLASRLLDIFSTIPSEAAFGDIQGLFLSQKMGDDALTGGSVKSVSSALLYQEARTGFEITNSVRGVDFSANYYAGSTISGGLLAFNSNANVSGSFNGGYTHFTAAGNFSPSNAYSGNHTGFQAASQLTGQMSNVQGYTDFNVINSGAVITGDYRCASLTPAFQTGSSLRSFTGIDVSPQFNEPITDDVNGLRISLATANATSVVGLNVNMSGAVSSANPDGPIGISTDGRLSVNTTNALVSGLGFQIGNRVAGLMHVPAGSPLTGTDALGNNLAGDFLIEDDVTNGGFGIGLNSVGFIATLAVAATKSVDTVTIFLPACSLADPGIPTGGTVDQFHMVRIFPPLPQGGTAVINNAYAIKIDSAFGDFNDISANSWGLYLDTAANNYFGGSINIGAASKKVTNSDVALEVGSLKAILLARLTTTQKNALTAVAGMALYDSTLNQLSYYNGASWVNV